MGGLKPRAGTALANRWPMADGVAWRGSTGVTVTTGTASATVWQTWQAVQDPQASPSCVVAAVGWAGASDEAAMAALPWQSA